ncbi:hypothetical protein Tco_0024907 [Tanacetum coccineum]
MSHPMTLPTLLMLLKSHSLSNRTPVKIPRKVLHKSTAIVVTSAKVPVISNPEPCQNQTIKELPQTLPSVHPTHNYGDEDSFTYDSNHNFVDDSPNPPPQPSAIQQYLQHEHYALWEVIEFGDSYRAPAQDKSVSGEATPSSRSKGRTVAVTTKDMQKRRNDVKARTTLLLALPDEHQLRFSKYETTKELWEAILRTFGGNEATKKTKKNLLKQQYGNFKAEGSETLEQTFNRLQAIVSQLEFLDVPVEQEDLNQKFLTSLSPEWLMHTIVWRNRNDLDTMSLDDLYNHLKVYESEVQKKL